jgi:hypothetical protein
MYLFTQGRGGMGSDESIPHWPLPTVRDLTQDGRLSTYDESVLKLSKVSLRGKYACKGHPLRLPSPTALTWLGHFPPASQAGRLAGPVFYTISFLWVNQRAGERGDRGEYRSQSWVEKPTRRNVHKKLTIYDKHLPQSPFTGHFFLDDNILY